MGEYQKGQRWVSESEPELGVGVVVDVSAGRVFLLFRASETLRQYASSSAPIKRVEFRVGDSLRIHSGETLKVDAATEREGIWIYQCDAQEVPETELSDTLSFSKPEERLFGGQIDENATFDLRFESLRQRHQIRHAAVHGFVGARIDLIPHQLYIAQEVAARLLPRVLLADEVGLGKTIEACLILHRVYRSGRAGRILILVPEPLVHQWFVELLRRFNLRVSIFDEERCVAIESGEPDANPFLDDQVILCPLAWVAQSERRREQVVAAGWDLLVVDEAHHLEWSPELASPEYQLVENLATVAAGVILLTATPEQLGTEAHFARLRLLDPHRYTDYATFEREREDYQKAAKIAGKLMDGKTLTAVDIKGLRELCQADPKRLDAQLANLKTKGASAAEDLIQELLDQHGTGRVMFRNTRAAMKGFPKRKAHFYALDASPDGLRSEREADDDSEARRYQFSTDSRLAWLVDFLQKKRKAKVLLICRTREKVLAIDEVLRARLNVKIGLFHEDLTLLQRDRNAAWFSEEDGAQILLCSEIGSEGRNFQFAHHLVLFDLPENPELLEQRIGRLDRIGQTETIAIHVPYPNGSYLENLARWYHEGLKAFEKSLEGGREILRQLGKRIPKLLEGEFSETTLAKLIEDTQKIHAKISKELEQGQDRLLQMNSFRPAIAQELVAQIAARDRDQSMDEFVLRLFDHFGVHVEELAARTYLAIPANLTTNAFPEMPEEGLTLTADRAKALSREEISFLTWDHPIVTGAIDLLVGSEQGNSAFAIWESGEAQSIYLETIFVVEPVAPASLHLDRFLPATPVRIVVDAKGEDVSASIHPPAGELKAGSIFRLLDNGRIKQKILPAMLEKSQVHAKEKAELIASKARQEMETTLQKEVQRLRDLQRANRHVRDEEITLLESHLAELNARISEAPLRLDSVRLIWQLPATS